MDQTHYAVLKTKWITPLNSVNPITEASLIRAKKLQHINNLRPMNLIGYKYTFIIRNVKMYCLPLDFFVYKGNQALRRGTWFEAHQACSEGSGDAWKLADITDSPQVMRQHGIKSLWINVKSKTTLQDQNKSKYKGNTRKISKYYNYF